MLANDKKLQETCDYINQKTNGFKPEAAIILGSGLGSFCDELKGISISYKEIPHFGFSDVLGHKGEFLFSEINGKNCAIMQGRFHFYEGNPLSTCVYPIKVLKMLGVKTLFITNAAGSTKKEMPPGSIMLITDHINFMGTNPLIGKNDDSLGVRFPDMTEVYKEKLLSLAKKEALNLNINLKEGVYLATTGPSYETKAEVKAFNLLGADAIGMSSVPEAITANYLSMDVVGFSLISNYASGVSNTKLSHEEVLEAGKNTGKNLADLIKKMIEKL